jgi:hypothetical protein
MASQRRNNQIKLIGQRHRRYSIHSSVPQQPADHRPGHIDLLASPASIANRHYNSVRI